MHPRGVICSLSKALLRRLAVMHTAAELSQQRSPKMTLHSESELARGPCQGQVLSREPSLAHGQAIKVKSWKLMSCKSQVLLEHRASQVIQQLNKMSAPARTCPAHLFGVTVRPLCPYAVQLGPAAPFTLSYGLICGCKRSVQPNYTKKNNNIFSYLPLLISSQSTNSASNQQLSRMWLLS